MSLIGKIKTLFSDKEKTQPIFPRTKIKAVSDDNGVRLDVVLEEMKTATNNAQTIANNAIPKTGGEVVGNIDFSGYASTRFKTKNGALKILSDPTSEYAYIQAITKNDDWVENILKINTATGAVEGGQLMPKAGGTFTGGVQAFFDASSNWTIKNNSVVTSNWNATGTNVASIYFVRE